MRHLLLLLLLFFLCTPAPAQSRGLRIPEQEWRDVTGEADYREHYRDRDDEEGKPQQAGKPWRSEYIKYIVYALAICLIVVIVARLVQSFDKNPQVESPKQEVMTIEEAEERIHEADLDTMLQQALAGGNYRNALRVRFLIVIRTLSQKGAIEWARERTNWEYHRQLKDRLVADQYREIVMNFERCWYGEQPFTERDYRTIAPVYEALQQRLAA